MSSTKKLPRPCMIRELFRYLCLLFRGKIAILKKEEVSNSSGLEDEPTFCLFREVRLRTKQNIQSSAELRVSFSVKKMDFVQKVVIPVLSQPFYMGLPGFYSKQFFLDRETCSVIGLYKWESKEAAKNYINGYALKFMELISLPGTFKYKIY